MALATLRSTDASLRCTCGGSARMQSQKPPVLPCPTLRQSVIGATAVATVAAGARKGHSFVCKAKQTGAMAARRRTGCTKAAAREAGPEPVETQIPVEGVDDERPSAASESAPEAAAAAAQTEGAEGTSTSEIMDMIEELVEEASGADDTGAEEAEETGEALKAKVSSLTAQLRQSEEAQKASQERYIRLNADFDNFRKRSAAEKGQLTDKTKADTIRQLLAVVDSFEMAKGSLKPEGEGEQKIDGAYQGVYKQMVEAFRSLGVEAVPGPGNIFDPECHEAIMREENDDVPDGTVLKEFRRGFKLGNQLLRAAMVQVSFSDEPSPPAAKGDSAGSAPAEEAQAAEPAAQEL